MADPCFVGHVYNLKTAESSNYWHFRGNRLLLLTKNALMKRCQKFGQGPLPLIWTKSKRTASFFRETFSELKHSSKVSWIHSFIGPLQLCRYDVFFFCFIFCDRFSQPFFPTHLKKSYECASMFPYRLTGLLLRLLNVKSKKGIGKSVNQNWT